MRSLPKQWVVFRLSALGDVVLATGVLRHWHRTFNWRFHVLTKDVFAPVFENNPVVESVIPATADELRMPRTAAWFAELAKQYRGWGLLDLHGTIRSAMLAAGWKGPVRRYAKHLFARRAFLLTKSAMFGDTLRAVNVPQRYAMAVEKTPPPARELLPFLCLTDHERLWSKSFLANLFSDDVLKNAPVAIHPFAAHPHKAWPKERHESLVAALDAQGTPWIVVGRGTPFFPGDPRDLTGKTALRESAALIAACRALVTGDSGPMHLASAVGTPVIGLFGPTTREWGFFPAGPLDLVLERDMPCRPCSLHGKKVCPNNCECLAAVDPQEVMAALRSIPAKPPDRTFCEK